MEEILYLCVYCDRYYTKKKRAFECSRKDIKETLKRNPKCILIPRVKKYVAHLTEVEN